jgi:hypothetical protein
MATDNPRIQVMLDSETNALLKNFAVLQDRSISSAAAELIREALEIHEDMFFSKLADKRFSTTRKWLKHEDVWNN